MSLRPTAPFHVAFTADFFGENGRPRYPDFGLAAFECQPQITVSNFARHEAEIQSQQLRGVHGVVVLTPRVTRATLAGNDQMLAVGRFGVGYDSVDVAACTESNVLVMITAGAVNHSMAEAIVGWMLALSHHIPAKDRLVRDGRWNDRASYMGSELRDRTLGVIGLGGIGRTLLAMLSGFRMRPPLVFDPFVNSEVAAELGARAVSLDELLTQADFVSVNCPLNDSTRGLIGAKEIAQMKPTAFLINTARGGIVEESALLSALRDKRIAGAALDCFETEPVVDIASFVGLENLILAPHAIGWTDELFRDIGTMACRSMVELSRGIRPSGVLNPELFERPGFLIKWAAAIGCNDVDKLGRATP
jgi:phosphoglycerate dehydrogenase-like enzyme